LAVSAHNELYTADVQSGKQFLKQVANYIKDVVFNSVMSLTLKF